MSLGRDEMIDKGWTRENIRISMWSLYKTIVPKMVELIPGVCSIFNILSVFIHELLSACLLLHGTCDIPHPSSLMSEATIGGLQFQI